nr:hypothetical protein OH820_16250 [Streptomyces sp. NBC_00857]
MTPATLTSPAHQAAYRALLDHICACPPCAADAPCTTGVTLQRIERAERR